MRIVIMMMMKTMMKKRKIKLNLTNLFLHLILYVPNEVK